jgi:hypothetical protein
VLLDDDGGVVLGLGAHSFTPITTLFYEKETCRILWCSDIQGSVLTD